MGGTARNLIYVTDLGQEGGSEDLEIATALSGDWHVTIATPEEAAGIAVSRERTQLLIRNAWPSREHAEAFGTIEGLVRQGKIAAYNPPSVSRGYREDKGYLADLHGAGYATIPTWRMRKAAAARGGMDLNDMVFKPLDGSSGDGIVYGRLDDLPDEDGIYQPRIDFDSEVSIFLLDGAFAYALESKGERWNLVPFEPKASDLAWAERFAAWNDLPYGIQRIDGARTVDGRLYLMEIEDFMPYLSLDAIDHETKARFMRDLRRSLIDNMR